MASELLGQIACFVFALALLGLSFFVKDVKTPTRVASIMCTFALVLLGAVGPQSILDFTFKGGGYEIGIKRHDPSESEKSLAVSFALGRDNVPEEQAKALLAAAEKRTDAERAPSDFLVLANNALRGSDSAQALELAYRGLSLESDPKVKAGLEAVIGETLKTKELNTLSAEYFDRATLSAPELKTDVQRLKRTDIKALKPIELRAIDLRRAAPEG